MKLKFYYFNVLLLLHTAFAYGQVSVTQDIAYIDDALYDEGRNLLDIYMPEGQNDVPVIVYFHGGALLGGDKSGDKELGYQLAKAGIGLVSANYRLSPEFHHPTHVNDAAAATAWVIHHIKAYGGNPQKVYVSGHSAGAYLAALLAIDTSLLKVHETGDYKIAGAVLISPFLYVEETARDRIEQDSVYKSIWGNNEQSWLKASVTPHIGPHHDNILLIYADGDDTWRKQQNKRFAQAMIQAGNHRVLIHEVPNRNHGSIVGAILDKDDQVINLISDFILNP